MIYYVLLVSLLAAPADEWQPPEKPIPSDILQEARGDAAAGRYDEALAKHLWYHRNAVKIEPAQSGVRVSVALTAWKKLADTYPPALGKLFEVRNEAAAKLVANEDASQAFSVFQEFAAINKMLGEEPRTVDLFAKLHLQQPTVAKLVYALAEPALVRAREYPLCSYYLDSEQRLRVQLMSFDANKRLAKDPKFARHHLDFSGRERFTDNIATLVALLVVNGRTVEAEKTAVAAKKEWDDPTFHAAIDDALKGHVPEPRP
jgi:hypothetical protein